MPLSAPTKRAVAMQRARPVAQSIEQLYDGHGSPLFSLACVLLGDRAEAEVTVTHILFEASRRPNAASDPDCRRHLARCVYLRCTRAKLGTREEPPDTTRRRRHRGMRPPAVMNRLGSLSQQQRAVVGLSLYGAHTYTQIAGVMSLPGPVVCELLRSGLRQLDPAND